MNNIQHSLSIFCRLSRQKINYHKSKAIFSVNCTTSFREEVLLNLGIKSSSNFGKHLGFPIFHKNPRSHDFQYILDNMNCRLSNWKLNFLNYAARITLARSTLNAIPAYPMQYLSLPTKTFHAIDKIQCDFMWGNTNNQRKMHYINWDTITSPINHGGLGIHKESDKNKTHLASWLWVWSLTRNLFGRELLLINTSLMFPYLLTLLFGKISWNVVLIVL